MAPLFGYWRNATNRNLPQTDKTMPKPYLVCRSDELKDGDRRVMSCDGTEVGVFKVDGQLFAWYNECPHRQGPVCQGRIYHRVLEPIAEDGTVRALAYDERALNLVCSWHGYEFDLKTGVNQGYDKLRLRKAKLEEKDGQVYVVV
jgi:nitrite reductase (NADH) small subunit